MEYWNTEILELEYWNPGNFQYSNSSRGNIGIFGMLESWTNIRILENHNIFRKKIECWNTVILENSNNIGMLEHSNNTKFQEDIFEILETWKFQYFQKKYWITGILESRKIPHLPRKYWNIGIFQDSNISIFQYYLYKQGLNKVIWIHIPLLIICAVLLWAPVAEAVAVN